MKTVTQNVILSAIVGAFILSLSACNTVKGVGKDTERAGEIIQKEADQHTDKD
jgi:predicted small secreted protein